LLVAFGAAVVLVVLSRNAFLVAQTTELIHRAIHAITGDNYDKMRDKVLADPWFGKNGVSIVTGSNSGMGYEAALDLARTGTRVIMAVRNETEGKAAAEKIKQITSNNNIDVMKLDLASIDSVRAFADAFLLRKLPIHVLMHNAGLAGKKVSINKDGFENSMAINYVNVVLLTSLLLPALKKSVPCRVVMVSSSAQFQGTKSISKCLAVRASPPIPGFPLYGSTKLNLSAYCAYIARQAEKAGLDIHFCSLDPGFVATRFYSGNVPFPINLFGMAANFAAKSPKTGAHTHLYAALRPTPVKNGVYLADTMESSPHAAVCDEAFQQAVVDETVTRLRAAAPWWDGKLI
jgi:NAD(P)-dependent dehydrogenase (short-subunit alcohol dehydrogenase family)